MDQTPYDYNNWQAGEPNFADDFRYCAKVYEYGVGEDYIGKWDDTLCDTKLGFICEKKRCMYTWFIIVIPNSMFYILRGEEVYVSVSKYSHDIDETKMKQVTTTAYYFFKYLIVQGPTTIRTSTTPTTTSASTNSPCK